MHAFLCTLRPRSVQAKTSEKYKVGVLSACKRYCPTPQQLEGPLYGIVYYFHRKPNDLDADNLSKPIWDALEGYLYADDRVIQLRKAGIRDLREATEVIDLTAIPETVADDFIEAIDGEDYLIYVELGLLRMTMFTFASERRYDK